MQDDRCPAFAGFFMPGSSCQEIGTLQPVAIAQLIFPAAFFFFFRNKFGMSLDKKERMKFRNSASQYGFYPKWMIQTQHLKKWIIQTKVCRDWSGLRKKALRNFHDEALSSEHDRMYSKDWQMSAQYGSYADRSIVRCSFTMKILAFFLQP